MAKPARSRRHLSSSPFAAPVEDPIVIYTVGERVSHDSYGLGRVVKLEGNTAVNVDFGTHTERIPLPSRKLFPL
ncbi:hypothetical protein BH09ACT10_BH09ACT10_31000 [soil metagenome]